LTLRWLLASLHLLGLGVGLGAVIARGLALRSRLDRQGVQWVFLADTAWGAAALLWIVTGLWRALGGVEKPTAYYFHNHAFLTKMGLFTTLLALELWPMLTLIAWRRNVARGEMPDTSAAPRLARISFLQGVLVVLMVFLATAMARGYGA
jgi:putative membrane protein